MCKPIQLCFYDLDLDLMTLILDLDLDITKMYVCIKMKFVGQRIQELEIEQDKQTDRRDRTYY